MATAHDKRVDQRLRLVHLDGAANRTSVVASESGQGPQ